MLVLTIINNILGQSKTIDPNLSLNGNVKINCKYYGDSIAVRWGYDNPQLWYYHITHSVELYRRDVTNNGNYEKIGEFIPWDSTKMEQTASIMADPSMMVVALENIHRHWNNTLFDGYNSVLERSDNFYNRWTLVHLAADRDIKAAEACGMRYIDKKIKPKTTYAYKIVARGNTLKSDYRVVAPVIRPFKPVMYNTKEEESSVTLIWEKKLHDYHYSSYWIERSVDGKNYTKVNEAPFVQLFAEDLGTKPVWYTYKIPCENYKKTWFRIRGLDAFGDVSEASESVIGIGRDRTPPPPPILTADSSMTHLSQVLRWKVENPAELKTFHLERSFGDASFVRKNWAQGNENFKKDTFLIEGMYKYRLIAVDTAGNESFSSPIYVKAFDLQPPMKPHRPMSNVDTMGHVLLRWEATDEKDILGYHVFAADSKGRNFVKLTSHFIRERIYVDSLNLHLLNQSRFYRIVAVDNDYMESEASDILEVKLPDINPPAPAIIGDYRVSEEGIRLTILPSSSRDVVRHELRRKDGLDEWKAVASFNNIPPFYLDSNIIAGVNYKYKVIAIDRTGLESASIKDIELTGKKSIVNASTLNYGIDSNRVVLNWKSSNEEYAEMRVYKLNNGNNYVKIATIKKGNFTYVDQNLAKGNTYKYRIQSIKNNGQLSAFSNEVVVNY